MDVKLCNMVLKFIISDSKAGPQACPNRQVLSGLFLTNHSWDFFLFLYDDY